MSILVTSGLLNAVTLMQDVLTLRREHQTGYARALRELAVRNPDSDDNTFIQSMSDLQREHEIRYVQAFNALIARHHLYRDEVSTNYSVYSDEASTEYGVDDSDTDSSTGSWETFSAKSQSHQVHEPSSLPSPATTFGQIFTTVYRPERDLKTSNLKLGISELSRGAVKKPQRSSKGILNGAEDLLADQGSDLKNKQDALEIRNLY